MRAAGPATRPQRAVAFPALVLGLPVTEGLVRLRIGHRAYCRRGQILAICIRKVKKYRMRFSLAAPQSMPCL